MPYGSAALGSTSLGGAAAAQQYFFFHSETLAAPGTYRRTAEFNGISGFYAVTIVGLPFDPPRRVVYIYTHNDPHETPQLQVTAGEDFYLQLIIASARFIVVELDVLAGVSPLSIDISGQEYFQ